MSELIRIMEECWSEKAGSRLTSLNIRYSLDKLIVSEDGTTVKV